jgi:hypothetical protein
MLFDNVENMKLSPAALGEIGSVLEGSFSA